MRWWRGCAPPSSRSLPSFCSPSRSQTIVVVPAVRRAAECCGSAGVSRSQPLAPLSAVGRNGTAEAGRAAHLIRRASWDELAEQRNSWKRCVKTRVQRSPERGCGGTKTDSEVYFAPVSRRRILFTIFTHFCSHFLAPGLVFADLHGFSAVSGRLRWTLSREP